MIKRSLIPNFFSPSNFKKKNSIDVPQGEKHKVYERFRKKIKEKNKVKFSEYIEYSKSQILQDLFVLNELDFKSHGFFVEFGATNGINFSNSYLLEKYFGWKGILVEPAKKWHKELRKHRSVNIDYHCVWRDSGRTLLFNETEIGEISTLDRFSKSDQFSKDRRTGKKYHVNTISLLDLLNKYKAPKIIDYLSIDTEGSEWEILKAFDFQSYKFRVITCEHNFSAKRRLILNLLSSHGYKRKFSRYSKFDDWYVLKL